MPDLQWWQAAVLMLAAIAGATWLMLVRARLAAVAGAKDPEAPASSLAEGLADLAAVRAEWRRTKLEFDAYLEAFEDLHETVERKRRRTAALKSKVTEAERLAELPPPIDLRARARALGIPV